MAQLGARLNGIQEVTGSTPVSSTSLQGSGIRGSTPDLFPKKDGERRHPTPVRSPTATWFAARVILFGVELMAVRREGSLRRGRERQRSLTVALKLRVHPKLERSQIELR